MRFGNVDDLVRADDIKSCAGRVSGVGSFLFVGRAAAKIFFSAGLEVIIGGEIFEVALVIGAL